MGVFGDFEGDGLDAGHDFRGGKGMTGAFINHSALLRWSGTGTYWPMIDRVLPSRSLMQPCSAWGRNVVSESISRAAHLLL